jgi:nitroimidazol reductase NimA-like FMN-containing flavoprotein (pyridoxamine 5'-phosphate oxidase superfamily)
VNEPNHRFRALPTGACREHLEHTSIGRVGWTSRKGPQILPVTYLLHDDQIVFRTDPHGPLAGLQGGEPVVFEIDELDPSTRCGWSVVVRGRAYSTQRSARADHFWREADPVPWAAGQRTVFVSVTLDELTGRSVDRERDRVDEEDIIRR